MPDARKRPPAKPRRPRARAAKPRRKAGPELAAKVAAKAAAKPRREGGAAKPAKPRRGRAAASQPAAAAVIALPYRPEPLTAAEIDFASWSALAASTQQAAPLPRTRAIALHREGGLLGAVADWLGTRTQLLWRQLSAIARPAPRRRFTPRPAPRPGVTHDDELQRLRAENERLRLQLEALVALQSAAAAGRAASPV